MAERSGSLDDFNVNDLFRAFEEKGGFIGAFASSPMQEAPLLPAPEADANFPLQLRNFQIGILVTYFNGRTLTDIRKDALDFKKSFESRKKITLSAHGTLGKKFYEHTTLESLATFSKEQHEDFVKRSGSAIPGSHEHSEMQREAGMWDLIRQHVQAAAELPDE